MRKGGGGRLVARKLPSVYSYFTLVLLVTSHYALPINYCN